MFRPELLKPEISDASEILHLKLWEGTAFDYSLNGNNGTVTGTAPAYQYPGLLLPGTDEYIEISDVIGLSPILTPLSVGAWIKMTSATNFTIACKYNAGATTREWLFYSNASDKLQITIYDETNDKHITRIYNTAVTGYQGIWIHVAGTYNGGTADTDLKIYIYGANVDDTSSGEAPFVSCRDTAAPVDVGLCEGVYSNGVLDDIRIYNTTRTAAQIKDFYEQTRWRYGV